MVPEEAGAFDALFWQWLLDVAKSNGAKGSLPAHTYTPLSGMSVDLGCGYPTMTDATGTRNPLLCQDCDDEMTLNVHLLLMEAHAGTGTGTGTGTGDEGKHQQGKGAGRETVPSLEIVVGDETPIMSRWIRLDWWRTHHATENHAIVCCRQSHAVGNATMFDALTRTPEALQSYQWLTATCWYVGFGEPLPGFGPELIEDLASASEYVSNLLEQLCTWADTTALCHMLVKEAQPQLTIAGLQADIYRNTIYQLTDDNIGDLLECSKKVAQTPASQVPFTSFCKAPQKMAEDLLLCAPSRRSEDCVLSQLLLDNELDEHVRGQDTRIGKRPAPHYAPLLAPRDTETGDTETGGSGRS